MGSKLYRGERRVLFIASRTRSLVNFRGDLVNAMRGAGYGVAAALPLDDGSLPNAVSALSALGVEAMPLPIDRAGVNPLSDLPTLVGIARAILRVRPRVLFAYTAKPVVYGMLVGWLLRVPRRFALVTGLGYHFTGERRSVAGNVLRMLYRLALARASLVFFQNPDDEALMRRSGILPATVPSCIVNGSGINLDRFPVVPVPPHGPVFLMIARLLGDKGVREYVAAAAAIRAEYPAARFQLVGWIDQNPDSIAREELDAWIAAGTVEFLGKLEDVRPALASCHVYVLPSYREGTPRTVLEAMATGRAVVTTDAPGCRETVVDGQNGWLVPVRSVGGLADAMRKFVAEPELAARMGARARQIAEERYDVRKVNATMLRAMGMDQG